jgi:chromosome partitioning protein
MSRVISLVSRNNSGKTFVSTCLGIELAKLSKKVLLVDLDPQAKLTSNFSIAESRYTSYHAMVESGYFEMTALGENLFMIPSVPDLIGCELELVVYKDREYVLRKFLEKFSSVYDYILIDTPPSVGLLTANALFASDMTIIPIRPEGKMFARDKHLIKAIEKVNALTIYKPLVAYFLLNNSGSFIPIEKLKASFKEIYSIDFLKSLIYGNYLLSETLNEIRNAKLNPYEHFKPSLDFKKLALEIINLKNQ